jgi:hypothetical protein
MGSHRVVLEGWWKRRKLPPTPAPELHLAHLPVRSIAQLRKKVLVGWLATLAKPNRRPGESHHWERLFARLKAGATPSAAELRQIAVDYAAPDLGPWEDPQTVDDPVRSEGEGALQVLHAQPGTDDVVAPLAQLAEELARRLAEFG